MKANVYIRFDGNKIPGGPGAVLEPAGCGPDVADIEYVPVLKTLEVWVTLEDTDERLPRLLELLARHGITAPFTQRRDTFTNDEFEASRLIIMQPNGLCDVDGGIEWGTGHDLSQGCPACGTGSPQTTALLMDGEELSRLDGHRAAASYHWHIMVDERLAADVERCNPSGLYFRSVYAVMPDKRQVKTHFRQLCAEPTLPRMSTATTGLVRERPCQVCNRNGYARTPDLPTRIAYSASDLANAADANMTFEWFGFAVLEPDLRESLLSHPWILITPKVWRIFRDAGVTEFDWLPIRVVDE